MRDRSHESAAAALILCAALVCMYAAAQSPERDAWPMFRGNASLTGVYGGSLPAALKLRWTFQAKDSIESSAAISDGTAYVGSMDGHLYAVDLATGKPRW